MDIIGAIPPIRTKAGKPDPLIAAEVTEAFRSIRLNMQQAYDTSGTATGNMLLVLRPGETDRKAAEAKLKNLERFTIRVLGAVFNDVPFEGPFEHYSHVYGYAGGDDGAQSPATSEVTPIPGSVEPVPPRGP